MVIRNSNFGIMNKVYKCAIRGTATIVAVMLSMFAISCSNDEPAFPTEPGAITFTAPAEIESASSRVSYTQIPGSIKVEWKTDDEVDLISKDGKTLAKFAVTDISGSTATFTCTKVIDNANLENVTGVFRYVSSGEAVTYQTENGVFVKNAGDNSSTQGTQHLQFANVIESQEIEGRDLTKQGNSIIFKNSTAIFRVVFKLSKDMESGTTIRIYGSSLWGSNGFGTTMDLNFKVTAGTPIVAYIPVPAGKVSGVLGFRVSKDNKTIFEYARTAKMSYVAGNEYTANLSNVTQYVQYDENGRGYVNLAGTNWATMNIGATDIIGDSSHGGYFKWGSKEAFDPQSPESESSQAALYNISDLVKSDNDLPSDDDIAHIEWEGNWYMPTKKQCDDLLNQCYWSWDEEINCYVVSSKDGDSLILLHATSYYNGSSLYNVTNDYPADYWTSTVSTGNEAYCMQLTSTSTFNSDLDAPLSRDCACPIRAVYVEP